MEVSRPAATRGMTDLQQALAAEESRLLACVHCGFCLDACPTYTRLGFESDSPRGRLYLMRAVAERRIQPESDAFDLHIGRCLGCRACEPVCPSGVQYGHLLETARDLIARTHGTGLLMRALLATFGNRVLTRIAGAVGRLIRGTGLASFLATRLPGHFERTRFALGMLAATRPWSGLRSASSAPVATAPAPRPEPGAAPAAGLRVAVLRGCVQSALLDHVNAATDHVLRVNGCTPVRVPGQGCCGALHAHGGALERARELARANLDAFERVGADVIVANAAGCGATLKEYGTLLEDRPEEARAQAFAGKVLDISELLVRLGPRTGAPIPLRAAWDAPCHLIHAQGIVEPPLLALNAVPGLDVVPVENADECCGGAGIHGLTHPELGTAILADKLAAIGAVKADLVITPNPGCMMQIGAGLHLAGDPMPVLHPVELLAESYRLIGLEGNSNTRRDVH